MGYTCILLYYEVWGALYYPSHLGSQAQKAESGSSSLNEALEAVAEQLGAVRGIAQLHGEVGRLLSWGLWDPTSFEPRPSERSHPSTMVV